MLDSTLVDLHPSIPSPFRSHHAVCIPLPSHCLRSLVWCLSVQLLYFRYQCNKRLSDPPRVGGLHTSHITTTLISSAQPHYMWSEKSTSDWLLTRDLHVSDRMYDLGREVPERVKMANLLGRAKKDLFSCFLSVQYHRNVTVQCYVCVNTH